MENFMSLVPMTLLADYIYVGGGLLGTILMVLLIVYLLNRV